MKSIRNVLASLIVFGGFVALISLLHAQETGTLAQSETGSMAATTDASALSDVEVEVKAIEMTTPLPAAAAPESGNFYSTQHLPGTADEWPPLPADTLNLPVWPLGDDFYLLDDLNVDYAALQTQSLSANGGMRAMTDFAPLDLVSGTLVAGTNLWLAITNLADGTAGLRLSNTLADVQYEIQATTNLTQPQWVSIGTVLGSEITNWTAASVAAAGDPALFLRVRSDLDSDNIGIPDWWQLEYFGYVGIDPYADSPSGDGFTIWQKYQNNLNPNAFETPPAPGNFVAVLSTNGTDVLLSWNAAQGSVTGYSLVKGVFDYGTYDYDYSTIGTVSAATTSFTDVGGVTDDDEYDIVYQLAANYPGGNVSQTANSYYIYDSPPPLPTPPAPVYNINVSALLVRNATGRWQLVFSAIPASVQTVRLDWDGFDYTYDYDYGTYASENISTNSITNNCYVFTDAEATNNLGALLLVQGVGTNDEAGNASQAGFLYSDAPCFVDAREHLKQNLIFQLRGATLSQPVGVSGNLYPYPFAVPADTNYVESSIFHLAYDNDATLGSVPYVQMNNLWPLDLNYQFHQFLYDPNYTGPSGFLWQTNFATVPAPAVLGLADPYWIQQDPGNMDDLGLSLSSDGTVVTLESGAHNLFGLNIEADLNIGPWPTIPINPSTGLPIYIPTFELAPGASTNIIAGEILATYYSQFQAPSLSTVGYYFAPVQNTGPDLIINGPAPGFQSIPIPALNGFAATNQTPPLIAAVGSTTVIGGWAKQQILNGANTKFAYLGQYFATNALLLDDGGNLTTNRAGILSPYGEFFPTQAGAARLVTMPDLDTGAQGTCTVYCVSLNVDANHDGTMDLSYFGQDQTAPGKPYVFWCNNNYDRWDYDSDDNTNYQDDVQTGFCPFTPNTLTPDCNYRDMYGNRVIPDTRDLEDYTRLWISGVNSNLLAALPAGSTVTLSWGDVGNPNPNNPTIDLFQATDTDGGIEYLTNETSAATQINPVYSGYVGRVAPGQGVQLNSSFFNGWVGNHFIWCGASNGTGGLNLTITDAHSNILGQATVYIQIVDIKQMYERWTVGDDSAQPPATTAYLAGNLPSDMTQSFYYTNPATAGTPYILFVHGWNMQIWEKDRFAESAFKRLYWQGYQGRFGEFRWPTSYGFTGTFTQLATNPQEKDNFDNSEGFAWLAGTGLLNKLNDLNTQYPGNVYVLAHSMGNVVAGEALRLAGSSQVVKTYVASQAAVSAHTYDPTVSNYSFSRSLPVFGVMINFNLGPNTPNIYGNWFAGNYGGGAGKVVSFYNVNDYALSPSSWQLDQLFKPDVLVSAGGTLWNYGYSGHTNDPSPWNHFYKTNNVSTTVNFDIVGSLPNRYEVMSHAAQSYTTALGATPGVHQVAANVDLTTLWPPDPTGNNYIEHFWHSAEFRGDYAPMQGYWSELLGTEAFNLK